MGYIRGRAVTGFPFGLLNLTTGAPVTSGATAGFVTRDGGGQAALADTPTHQGNGQWTVNLTATETDADIFGLVFTNASAVNAYATVKTQDASVTVEVVSPVGTDGTVRLVQGDDYLLADGRQLDWTNAAGDWPDLTGAAVQFLAGDGALTHDGDVVTPAGPGQKVRAEPTAAETGGLAPRTYDYQVRATLASGRKVTLVQGKLIVVDSEAG